MEPIYSTEMAPHMTKCTEYTFMWATAYIQLSFKSHGQSWLGPVHFEIDQEIPVTMFCQNTSSREPS